MSKEKVKESPEATATNPKLAKFSRKLEVTTKVLHQSELDFEEQLLAFRKAEKEGAEKSVVFPLMMLAKIAKATFKIKKLEYKLAKFELKMATKALKSAETTVVSPVKTSDQVKSDKPGVATRKTRTAPKKSTASGEN